MGIQLWTPPVFDVAYKVGDDHGLRSVELVLRSGAREERRVLSHLDGDSRTDRGAKRISADDPFFDKAYAPVEITVEARP